MNLSIGYDLYYKEGKNIDKKELSDEEISMKNTLKSWNKEEIYKFEGLNMAVYSKMIGGQKHVVVVNTGSETNFRDRTNETLYDWADNIAQLFFTSDDMKMSIEYAKKIGEKYKGANITFVGYSKGGAEAAANAVATNKDAVLFNPSSTAFAMYGLDEDDYTANTVSYIVNGEVLDSIFAPFEQIPGEKKYVGNNPNLWLKVGTISKDYLATTDKSNYLFNTAKYYSDLYKAFKNSIDQHMLDSFFEK